MSPKCFPRCFICITAYRNVKYSVSNLQLSFTAPWRLYRIPQTRWARFGGPTSISRGLDCRESVRTRFYASNDTSPMFFDSLAEHLNKDNIEYAQHANWAATYDYFLKVICVRIIFICNGKHSNRLLSQIVPWGRYIMRPDRGLYESEDKWPRI